MMVAETPVFAVCLTPRYKSDSSLWVANIPRRLNRVTSHFVSFAFWYKTPETITEPKAVQQNHFWKHHYLRHQNQFRKNTCFNFNPNCPTQFSNFNAPASEVMNTNTGLEVSWSDMCCFNSLEYPIDCLSHHVTPTLVIIHQPFVYIMKCCIQICHVFIFMAAAQGKTPYG
jgi:hypothetical protein